MLLNLATQPHQSTASLAVQPPRHVMEAPRNSRSALRKSTVGICALQGRYGMHGFDSARRVWPIKLFQFSRVFSASCSPPGEPLHNPSGCHLSNEPIMILSAMKEMLLPCRWPPLVANKVTAESQHFCGIRGSRLCRTIPLSYQLIHDGL